MISQPRMILPSFRIAKPEQTVIIQNITQVTQVVQSQPPLAVLPEPEPKSVQPEQALTIKAKDRDIKVELAPVSTDIVAVIRQADMQASVQAIGGIIGPIQMKYKGTLYLTITGCETGKDMSLTINNPYISAETDGDVPTMPDGITIESVKQDNGQVSMTLHVAGPEISANGQYVITIKDDFEVL